MYQLEVKRWLVHHRFPPSDGWKVRVHVDPMERANGGQHPPDKRSRAEAAETALLEMGASVGLHPDLGPADIVAEHSLHGMVVIEVEGQSSRQPEQAMYSALGQLVLAMIGAKRRFVLALPDEARWEAQALKIPPFVRNRLSLSCVLVSPDRVRDA